MVFFIFHLPTRRGRTGDGRDVPRVSKPIYSQGLRYVPCLLLLTQKTSHATAEMYHPIAEKTTYGRVAAIKGGSSLHLEITAHLPMPSGMGPVGLKATGKSPAPIAPMMS
jgi:hypothetical protein